LAVEEEMYFNGLLLLMVVSAAFGLQGADFDLYSSFSSSDEEADKSSPISTDGLAVDQILIRVGATIGIGGSAYIGFRLIKKLLKKLRKSSTSETFLREFQNERNDYTGVNATTVAEMKKEQEELWRFIHSLFKNQEEMMAKLEKSSASGVSESMIRDLEESFDSKIREVSKRLDMVESKLKGVERDVSELSQTSSSTQENIQGLIRREVEEISNSMVILKKEIKNQMLRWLKEHDDAIVEKIRFFGEDIKQLVKNDNIPDISNSDRKILNPKSSRSAGGNKR
jgi:hypothetical protein